MKVLVTGASGFVGKNLLLALGEAEGIEVLPYDLGDEARLDDYASECDFVVHLAGVNRPKDPSEFTTGNVGFTELLLERLSKRANPPSLILSSSIQAALDNDYGRSKREAEDAVRDYSKRTGARVFIYRLANVFGKWCRPNYNSAVATWCYNRARGLDIQVRDRDAEVTLVYIDDVVKAFVGNITAGAEAPVEPIISVTPSYTRKLGEIVDLIEDFRDEPQSLDVPNQGDDFCRKLYATFLSYLPEDSFSYPLTMHCDNRGSFTEALHSRERGQVSVNISRAGITKGEHWHHTKHEKFLVVSGKGVIRFRRVDLPDGEVISYFVSGESLEVVRIPPGYVHNIENLGDVDMVTVMWANEVFDPANPDTFRANV